MSIEDFLEDACMLVLSDEADGLGDTRGTYRQGQRFRAGFVQASTNPADMAHRRGAKERWRLLTLPQAPTLKVGDVVMRLSDGLRLRIISQAIGAPRTAQLQGRWLDAEVWL